MTSHVLNTSQDNVDRSQRAASFAVGIVSGLQLLIYAVHSVFPMPVLVVRMELAASP